jgi:hypothetical protein
MLWLLVGPFVSALILLACLFYLSWRNQNSPLVKKEDRPRRRPSPSRASFDPNAADAIPLNDYHPGVVVHLRHSSLAPILHLPTPTRILRFPIERIQDHLPPPPAPAKPPRPQRGRPRLRLVPPAE